MGAADNPNWWREVEFKATCERVRYSVFLLVVMVSVVLASPRVARQLGWL